jgi:hypothetical protein
MKKTQKEVTKRYCLKCDFGPVCAVETLFEVFPTCVKVTFDQRGCPQSTMRETLITQYQEMQK